MHIEIVEGKTYQVEYGNPFDRGQADSYYGRAYNPHYKANGKFIKTLTAEEIDNYRAGYISNTDFKEF